MTVIFSMQVTYNASSAASSLTSGGTVLKESDDLDILGVTFHPKMTFEKHLHSVSRAASQRLGILRKSWRIFNDRLLLGRCFLGLPCGFEVLFRSVVLGCRYTPCTTVLYRVVSGACFLTVGVFEGDVAHRRSLLFDRSAHVDQYYFMLYMIKCNPMHPVYAALPVPYASVRVTRGALVAHRYTDAPLRCRTSQYRRTFIPFSVSLWNDLAVPVFDDAGLAGFKGRANAFLLAKDARSLLVLYCFFLLPFSGLLFWGWGLWTDNVSITFSWPTISDLLIAIVNSNTY